MTTLIIIIIIAIPAFIVAMQQSEIARKCKRRECFNELRDFYYYVGTCKVNDTTRSYIVDRLKSERASRQMENPDYLNMVDKIARLFDIRFNKLRK
jgi:hypothetical protein